MAEYTTENQSPEVIAKELTLAAVQKIISTHTALGPDVTGKTISAIYKTILKNTREAIIEKKYE